MPFEFVAPYHQPPFTPIEVLVVLAMPVKNHLKWWIIQLVIHSMVDPLTTKNYSVFHATICFPFQDTVLQIIQIDTSK